MSRYGLWTPIPQRVGNTIKWGSRSGSGLRAVVIHRMEGSLEGSDSYLRREFADYYPYPRLNASAHFGVGLWNGVPQIRQWVDTAYAAYGWAGGPTDVPTTLARSVLGDLMYSKAGWPYYGARIDLNRPVIAIEVEGFASQTWDYRTTAKVKELLAWIARTHGRLWVMAHTDLSSKPCPGMATFKAALPGVYGQRIGYVAPAPSPTPTAGGLPVTFRSRYGWKAQIIKGKPRRNAARISATNLGTATRDEPIGIIAEVVGEDLGKYGVSGGKRWFVAAQYIGGRWRWVYTPLVDLKARSF